MEHKIDNIKKAIIGIFAAISATLGWIGWLTLLYFSSMLIEFISKIVIDVNKQKCTWERIRKEILKKLGSIFILLVSVLIDWLFFIATSYIDLFKSMSYNGFIFPLVLIWYTLVEVGAIVRHTKEMGTSIPLPLIKYLSVFNNILTKSQENKFAKSKKSNCDINKTKSIKQPNKAVSDKKNKSN